MNNNGGNNGFDAFLTIQGEFPALTYSLQSESTVKNLFAAVQNLANYTKEQLLEENQIEVEHCFRVAREILDKGGNIGKLAVENIFIYSISHLLEISLIVSQTARHSFLNLFKKEYCRQINCQFP